MCNEYLYEDEKKKQKRFEVIKADTFIQLCDENFSYGFDLDENDKILINSSDDVREWLPVVQEYLNLQIKVKEQNEEKPYVQLLNYDKRFVLNGIEYKIKKYVESHVVRYIRFYDGDVVLISGRKYLEEAQKMGLYVMTQECFPELLRNLMDNFQDIKQHDIAHIAEVVQSTVSKYQQDIEPIDPKEKKKAILEAFIPYMIVEDNGHIREDLTDDQKKLLLCIDKVFHFLSLDNILQFTNNVELENKSVINAVRFNQILDDMFEMSSCIILDDDDTEYEFADIRRRDMKYFKKLNTEVQEFILKHVHTFMYYSDYELDFLKKYKDNKTCICDDRYAMGLSQNARMLPYQISNQYKRLFDEYIDRMSIMAESNDIKEMLHSSVNKQYNSKETRKRNNNIISFERIYNQISIQGNVWMDNLPEGYEQKFVHSVSSVCDILFSFSREDWYMYAMIKVYELNRKYTDDNDI